jgi:hypothetical protein
MEPVPQVRRPRRRTGPLGLLAAAAGLLVASTMVWKASTAAFTATTTNGVNTFSAGTVVLTDNDSTNVLFNVGALAPGASGSACIRVTYNGTLTSDVRLYASGLSATNAIDTYLNLQVEDGGFSSLPTFPSCTNFVAGATIFNSTLNSFGGKTTWAAGVGSWTPTGAGQTTDYRFTYTLSSSAPNGVQGSTASLSFVWEAQSA